MSHKKNIYLFFKPDIKDRKSFRDIFLCGVDGLFLSFSHYDPADYRESVNHLLSLTQETHFFPCLYAEITAYHADLLPYLANYGITDLLLNYKASATDLLEIKNDLAQENLSHIRIHSSLTADMHFTELMQMASLYDSLYMDYNKDSSDSLSNAESFLSFQDLLEELCFARIPIMVSSEIHRKGNQISTSTMSALTYYVKCGVRDILLEYNDAWDYHGIQILKDCCDVIYASRRPQKLKI